MASLPYPRKLPRRHQTIFPQNLTQPNHLWASVKSVGEYSPPEISVNSVNSVGGLAESGVGMAGMPYPPNLWASVKSVGGSSLPEASVNSVNSMGEPYATKPSVLICAICGRIIKWAAWVWQGCHTLLSVFCGRTRTLNFCGFRAFRGRIRIPWGENTKRAWRNAMPSYVSYVDAWVWQGCHTLL